ncbi:uncharacterized protein LOC144884711 [Branchiostoma floridae x Branchiostoma japonicum]
MAEDIITTDAVPTVHTQKRSDAKMKKNLSYAVTNEFPNPTYETGWSPENDADSPNTCFILADTLTFPSYVFSDCTYRRIGVVVIITAFLVASILFGTWLYFNNNIREDLKTTKADDDTSNPGQPALGTPYTNGHPALNTTYIPGLPAGKTTYSTAQPASGTTYTNGHSTTGTTYTNGHPTVDTTYTNGHPAENTTYTNGHPTATDTTYIPGCPKEGYSRFNGVCYKSFSERKTRAEASMTCAVDGGMLAMPKDSLTNTFLANLAEVAMGRWIGLTDADRDGQWVFEDGRILTSSDYSNWRPGKPTPDEDGGGCVGFWGKGSSWDEKACTYTKGFICQLPEGCLKEGYSRFNGVCYKSFSERKTGAEASLTCAVDGGMLAMPKDSLTNTFLANLAEVVMGRWIGLTDADRDGQWGFEDGRILTSSDYSNWRPGEPTPDEDGGGCAGFWGKGSSWDEKACSYIKGFICQLHEDPKKKWRDDLRCGQGYPADDGNPAECDPDGKHPCCSPGNWCGFTTYHCNCRGCIDYRKN